MSFEEVWLAEPAIVAGGGESQKLRRVEGMVLFGGVENNQAVYVHGCGCRDCPPATNHSGPAASLTRSDVTRSWRIYSGRLTRASD